MVITDDVIASPDSTITAEKLAATTTNGLHTLYRNHNLTAYDTFDDENIKWDDTTNKFDEGAISIDSDTQQFTFSVFVKAEEYTSIRLKITLDDSTCLLYTSPSPRDRTRSRMPSSA